MKYKVFVETNMEKLQIRLCNLTITEVKAILLY